MWRKLFSLLVLSMMATASADCPSGQCRANDGSCMDNPSGHCRANDGSCMDYNCAQAGYGDAYCQQFWGSTSSCSNGECVNSCTNPESVLPTHPTQYTCAEVTNEYTTNCGTCGNTTPETASGLEKPPATLNEEEKLQKVIQWICDNQEALSAPNWEPRGIAWYEPCYQPNPDIGVFWGTSLDDIWGTSAYTPLDL